jgi:hypothetical protein
MQGEVRKLEQSVRELTIAVRQLTEAVHAAKAPTRQSPSRLNNVHLSEGPKTVCRDVNCNVINSGSTVCDHTIARYRSEYDCG